MATLGIADTAGVPKSFAETTIALPFNSIEAAEKAFVERGDQIAAVIVEPVVGNMGCVPPEPGFLEALRMLTAHYDALLIFDEVMTGFRVALGGAQERFGIVPDLTTLGKIIGGGLPLAAYGGRTDIMQKIAPLGPVYQAGTLSGNPMAVAAGLATVRYLLAHPEVYETLEARSAQLTEWTPPGGTVNRVGAMFTFFCSPEPVKDWESAKKCDTSKFGKLFHFLLERGIYMAPSQFEAGFVSTAHSAEDISKTVSAMKEFFAKLE
jgi:glutamate-1-semialdehyde 2,1-aminomutase